MTTLFGDEPPKKKARTPRALDPYFDAIADLITAPAARAAAGRVLRCAKKIKESGLHPDTLRRELPVVVARYAPWRKVLDIAAVESCWPWIVTPPRAVPRADSPLIQATRAIEENDGKRPF